MTPEQWQQVKALFHEATELAPEARAAFIEQRCDGDAELAGELRLLLASHDEAQNFIEQPAVASVSDILPPSESDPWKDKTIGQYRVLSEIGRGGMGLVLLAVRADDQFRQNVAIKVLRRGMDTDDILRRFRNERQILASLNHPNIANLYDGGTTPDGLPYFVMEYVEGLRLLQYVDEHDLSVNERLELFRKICAAVQHAHQNLIIHRDLKPNNILVTHGGEVKLLDFGVAKLVNPELTGGMTETQANLRVMTPEYASPEQVRGQHVTTATDIYSLGVILYELLTGVRPYKLKDTSPAELSQAICDSEPSKPSDAVVSGQGSVVSSSEDNRNDNQQPNPQSAIRNPKFLKGDLDNIVLKALKKEPPRRYLSVEQFSEDIRRHLEGLPVLARKDTFGYRAGKFVRRHKVGVASASLSVLALIAGLTTTVWQARAARGERARAERRFNDVRKLANSNLFELHDAIANLPGSTPARVLLVKRALEYLDSLAQESQDDASLQRELIAAYLKVGNVQGNPSNANLGDRAGALQSYRKALAITEQLTATNPVDAKTRRFIGVINEKMCDVQAVTGDIAGAVESQRKSLAIFKGIAEAVPANVEARQSLAISYVKLGDVLGNANFNNYGDQAGAIQSYRSAAEILDSLYASDPSNPKTRRLLGLIYERIGTMLELSGKGDEALAVYRKSLAIREPFAADNPTDTDAIRDVAIAHEKIGNVTAAKGELKEAMERRSNSLKIFKSLVEADPQNVQARRSLALSYVHLGEVLGNPETPNLGRPDEARKNYLLARDILSAIDGSNADVKTRETLKLIEQRIAALGSRP